jgi:hypothetical protein
MDDESGQDSILLRDESSRLVSMCKERTGKILVGEILFRPAFIDDDSLEIQASSYPLSMLDRLFLQSETEKSLISHCTPHSFLLRQQVPVIRVKSAKNHSATV